MVKRRLLSSLLAFFSLLAASHAVDLGTELSDHSPEASHQSELSYTDAVVLGLVEGLTEYLPVSSTGHLILANAFLGLNGDTPMLNSDGMPILVTTDDGLKRPYTIGEAAYAYTIVIQAGAIVAVVYLYWKTILGIVLGCIGRDPNGRKLAINLIAAFIPAAVIGLLLDDWIEEKLGDNITAVAGALIVGAIVMLVVEKWRKHGQKEAIDAHSGPELHDLPIPKAVMIGFFQCFAMWPGTSRSMSTIVGGYIAGLSPARAAEFSFLLGLITLSAASGYKFVSDGGNMLAALQVGPVLVGCIVAFVSATLAVKWLVGYLSKHGLAVFAWYRIALAIAVFYFIA
ncbi:MAG TPA: undecaprenyl-diphosphate phosphatase [Opitutae bacterium]|nr:undecaprenyl-diphosphate phosphatase [Opitutae bacterium]